MSRSLRRVAVIGGGPTGLEAALRASCDGFDVSVFERGDIADNLTHWGYVRLFSPFGMNRSAAGLDVVRKFGGPVSVPDDAAYLTGREFVDAYLRPLSKAIAERVRLMTRTCVAAVGREGLCKGDFVGDSRRADALFRLLTLDRSGNEVVEHADIVIDASGTYGRPNRLGSGGILAPGERSAVALISYVLDDVAGADASSYAGFRVLLVGGGYSAATSAVALATLREEHPDTHVFWLTRSADIEPIRLIENDRLPKRRELSRAANRLASQPSAGFERIAGAHVDRIEMRGGIAAVTIRTADGGERVLEVDRIIANVGYHPDRSLYEALQVHECYATSGPIKIAAELLGSASVDCLDRRSSGIETLTNPEPNFFILGAKSFGRNSSYLMRVGLEQIDQVFDSIRGA